MAHILTNEQIEDLEDYEFSHEIASAHGQKESKKLLAVVKGWEVRFEVWSHKELVHNSSMLIAAAHAYNDA